MRCRLFQGLDHGLTVHLVFQAAPGGAERDGGLAGRQHLHQFIEGGVRLGDWIGAEVGDKIDGDHVLSILWSTIEGTVCGPRAGFERPKIARRETDVHFLGRYWCRLAFSEPILPGTEAEAILVAIPDAEPRKDGTRHDVRGRTRHAAALS